jgi:hypothetical protein
MSALDGVRQTLRDFLQDMEVLKPYVDPANPEAEPFVRAFSAARERALEAAKSYASTLAPR